MPLRPYAERYPALIRRLLQALQARRLGHAYVISGDHAATIQGFAIGWLQACLCEQPLADGDACDTCATCRRVADETQPGIQVVKPKSKSRQIRIDDIRDMERLLFLKSGGQLKVGLILDAECLNVDAQNAFLKTLEEPGADTLLILVTVNPNALLATIRSRCQNLCLLDNRLPYEFADFPVLARALGDMERGAGAQTAARAADVVLSMLAERKAEAEVETKAMMKTAKMEAADLDAKSRKVLEEEIAARAASLYRERREQLLSAVHTWFSLEYLRATGVEASALPNREFYADLGEKTPPSEIDAHRALGLADDLINQLNFNVDESLAVTDFCLQICSRA